MPGLTDTPNLRGSRRGGRSEEGAVAILVAVSMVFLVLSAALILDFGMVRIDRQENKSGADAAALAGVDALVPSDLAPTDFRPFRGVCQAVRYVQANLREFSTISGATWTDGTGGSVTDGCTASMATAKCVKNAPSSWARFIGSSADGRLHLRIQSGYLVSDSEFSEETLPALQADPGVPMYGGCDQLSVIISETRQPTLGAIAIGDVTSTVRSVGRVNITAPKSPVALLILEQKDCGALIVNGSGDDTYVRVKKSLDTVTGNEAPGRIHMDSDGTGDGCNSKKIISTGTNHPDAVKAFASAESPGMIEVVAVGTTNQGNAADPYPNVNPEDGTVTRGEVLTRAPVDSTYLDGVRDEFSAPMPWNGIPATASGQDAIVTNCKAADASVIAAQAKTGTLYFNCPTNGPKAGSLAYGTNLVFNASRVVINEAVNMSGGVLAFPSATEIFIRGKGSTGIAVKGTFAVGSNGTGSCDNTQAASSYRKVLVGQGSLSMNDTGSSIRLCDTTVIMGSGQTNGCVPNQLGTYIDDGNVCPAAGGSAGTGTIDITGGNVDWVAPNRHYHSAVPEDEKTDAYRVHHEDLAFWSETAGTHTLRASASGTMALTGVFMVPNADQFDLGGNGNQFVSNSQYVVKKFNVHGGARLDMAPDPNDTVTPPQLGFSLVR